MPLAWAPDHCLLHAGLKSVGRWPQSGLLELVSLVLRLSRRQPLGQVWMLRIWKLLFQKLLAPVSSFASRGLGKGKGRPLSSWHLLSGIEAENECGQAAGSRGHGRVHQRTGRGAGPPGNLLRGFGSGPSCSSLSFPTCEMSALGRS